MCKSQPNGSNWAFRVIGEHEPDSPKATFQSAVVSMTSVFRSASEDREFEEFGNCWLSVKIAVQGLMWQIHRAVP